MTKTNKYNIINNCFTKLMGISMKKLFLLLLMVAVATTAFAADKNQKDQILHKSLIGEPPQFLPTQTSFPAPFSELSQPRTAATISTGYFWVDSDETIPAQFKNSNGTSKWDILQSYTDTNVQPGTWTRILPGPRILPKTFWEEYKDDGLPFFRNPADANNQLVNFYDHNVVGDGALDSVDDAIAGPMPISIAGGFFFNGIRYDSFYISTNGVIALTNRRYFYDNQGNRIVPTGAMSAYDPQSMDWFVTANDPLIGCSRCRSFEDNGGGFGTGDGVRDDFGYVHSVLGLQPNAVTTTPPTSGANFRLDGIRSRGTSFNALSANLKQALIAFAWGDMQMSQYNPTLKLTDGYAKAYFKRSINSDKLIIAIYNMAIVRTVNLTQSGNQDLKYDKRPIQDEDFVSLDAQIVLNGKDSSVTIIYKRVADILTFAFYPDYAYQAIRRNSICGVAGWARHVNYPIGAPAPNEGDATNYPPKNPTPEYFYPYATPAQNGEYQQYTVYFDKYRLSGLADENLKVPTTGTRVMFKQWKNVLRAPSIQYYVRETKDLTVPLENFPVKVADPTDYELMAGMPRIGAIQPVALVQNLTNDVQGPNGVNFTPQELNFQVRFKIQNQVTQKVVYNRLVPIDKPCLSATSSGNSDLIYQNCKDPLVRVWLCQSVTKNGAIYNATPNTNFDGTGYTGIPPYKFVQVYFPPFEPNEFIPSHIGRMKAFVTAEPYTPDGESLGDAWPFDDESSVNLFVMRRLPHFNDDVTEFHNIPEVGVNMPSVWKWVNIEGEVVNGESVSESPLPPRGRYNASYDAKFDQYGNIIDRTFSSIAIESPAIKLNRIKLSGAEPNPAAIAGRAGNGDELRSFPIDMTGVYNAVLSVSIQRTLKQQDWPRGWSDQVMVGPEPRVIVGGKWNAPYTNGNSVCANPDEIAVEIALPSDDGLNDITNLPDTRWSIHPRRFGMTPVGSGSIAKNPAITVLGGGGYRVGFLETDKDSSLTKEDLTGLGKFNGLRPSIFDDGVDHQFKKYFATIPDTFIRYKNEGAKNFRFRIKVFSSNDKKGCAMITLNDDTDDWIIDNVSITVPKEVPDIEVSAITLDWPYTMAPASQATSIPITVSLSNNSSRNAPSMSVKVKIYRTDKFGTPEKDPIYCRTENISNLNGGRQLNVNMPAWNARKSQIAEVGNYLIESMVVMAEKDLNTINDTNYTSVSLRFGNEFAYDPIVQKPLSNVGQFTGIGGRGLNFFASNFTGGNGSGQIAFRFKVLNSDTLRGYSTFFTGLSQSPEPIQVFVVKDKGGIPGDMGDIVAGTWYATTRGYNNILGFETYVTLPIAPVELAPGTYWLSISQLGEYGLNLGATAARMGMRTMNTFVALNGKYGDEGNTFLLDRNFRVRSLQGNMVNDNFFAYENVRFSGNWVQFSPPLGNSAYPHGFHYGINAIDQCTQTLQQGSWLPMHRPYFGPRTYGEEADVYQWCSDDLPIELTYFDAELRNSGVDLLWETSSETNNHGFYIEKREGTEEGTAWSTIGFKEGNGTTAIAHRYTYFDGDVVANHTYQYRLRQVDNDGTQSCGLSEVKTVKFGEVNSISLEQNSPNPFNGATSITFTLPTRNFTTLEVINVYGNVVKTLVAGELAGDSHTYIWDGTNDANQYVANGTYIYRLTSGSQILTGKMTLVK